MIIDQLPAISSVNASDELPIERTTTTYKTTVTQLSDRIARTGGVKTAIDGTVKNTPTFVADLNNINTAGFYNYATSSENTPSNRGGTLLVLTTSSYIFQLAFDVSSIFSASNFFVHVRLYDGSSWGNWIQFQSFNNSVTDVRLDGTSIVSGGIANILLSTIFAPKLTSNLNNATDVGFYHYNGGATNAPSTQGGVMLVLKHGSSIAQIAIGIGSTAYTGFVRTSNGTTWLAWKSFATSS